jgi:hypothetical protein
MNLLLWRITCCVAQWAHASSLSLSLSRSLSLSLSLSLSRSLSLALSLSRSLSLSLSLSISLSFTFSLPAAVHRVRRCLCGQRPPRSHGAWDCLRVDRLPLSLCCVAAWPSVAIDASVRSVHRPARTQAMCFSTHLTACRRRRSRAPSICCTAASSSPCTRYAYGFVSLFVCVCSDALSARVDPAGHQRAA